MKTLKLGDSGQEVKELQLLLISHGFGIGVDGQFGPQTQKTVKEFQILHGLKADGVVGPTTWSKLEGPKNEDNKPKVSFEFGKSFSPEKFKELVDQLIWTNWKPSLIVIHHCAEPSLAQRPAGFTHQHMLNIKDFYKAKGWSSGPHLFTDDDQIWTFSPLTAKGIHAVSFNSTGIGIEMLGDFDAEDPKSGRGKAVINTTVSAVKALMAKLNLGKDCIRFHRDDPKTSKTCPGTKITKEWFLSLL
jgi:hypothetical protein